MTGSLIPDPINLNTDLNLTGGVGVNANLGGNIGLNANVTGSPSTPLAMMVLGDPNKPVSVGMTVTGDANKPLSMLLIGDSNKPISVGMALTGDPQKPITAGIELLNLPRLTVQDIQKLMSMQISLPGHRQVCFKVMGVELFQVCYGGEGKVITEPYTPKDRCSEPVCQVDTRPFPRGDNNPPKGTDNNPPKD